MDEINKLDESLCIAVLAALAEIPKNFGYTKTIAFLRGSKSGFVIRNKLNENKYYGCFSVFSKESLERVIEYLFKEALIEIEELGRFNRPVLRISKFGLMVLGGREEITLKSDLFFKKHIDIQDEDLYDKLNELRYNMARKAKLPSFCICTNETIIDIANKKPQTKEDLLEIKGIGEKFIEKYSEEFLEIIKD
jgi:ATP-dependent DNA helicase RecQ|tara:strand:+ start:342 stop:920 length:579 start_codon:yes stop_codon:yes gene_type:complete